MDSDRSGAVDAERALRSGMRQFADALAAANKLNDALNTCVQAFTVRFPWLEPLESLQRRAEQLRSVFLPPFVAVFEKLRERIEEQPKIYRTTLQGMLRHGWYISKEAEVGLVAELCTHLRSGDKRAINLLMRRWTLKNMAAIQTRVQQRFPSRAVLLDAAFSAHRERRYALAIPLFLAQADGAARDLVDAPLFSKVTKRGGHREPSTAEFVRNLKLAPFTASLLSPLEVIGAMSAGEHEQTFTKGVLNRHAVVHGSDLRYATRDNDLRCICLLDFLATTVAGASRKQSKRERLHGRRSR